MNDQGVAGQRHAEELDRKSQKNRENYKSLTTHLYNDRILREIAICALDGSSYHL